MYFTSKITQLIVTLFIFILRLSLTFTYRTLSFMIVFSTFLVGCVNYSEIPSSHSLDQVIVPQCLSKLSTTKFLYLIMFVLWWLWQAIRFVTDIPALKEMYNFYTILLNIPDASIESL